MIKAHFKSGMVEARGLWGYKPPFQLLKLPMPRRTGDTRPFCSEIIAGTRRYGKGRVEPGGE